jgi:enoyl-CoA hydratase/carnithine racemase
LAALDKISESLAGLRFLILAGPSDPVHAGGDLKESLMNLDSTLKLKQKKEKTGAPAQEIDRLFAWADGRIQKGGRLHARVRELSQSLRVVAVCGGGTRFGGSAEISLMADYLVGDSRSGMCFSECMIGLIPGWAGVARAIVKAGPLNAAYMAKTGREVKAEALRRIGIYNQVVEIPFPFPKRGRSNDPEADKSRYREALAENDLETARLLLPEGLRLATCPEEEIPGVAPEDRAVLASEEEINREVALRKDPRTYSRLWGKPLSEAREEIAELGRPLAPQSIEALDDLFSSIGPAGFDEKEFVRREMEADSRLYRDQRFRAGLTATLEQRVADFRDNQKGESE